MGSILPYLPNFTQIVFYLHAKNQQNFAKKFKKKIEGLFFLLLLFFSDKGPSGRPDKMMVGKTSNHLFACGKYKFKLFLNGLWYDSETL